MTMTIRQAAFGGLLIILISLGRVEMSALAPLVDPSQAGSGLAVAASDPQAIPPLGSVPANMQLSRNPMLPAHPLGAYTDSQYEANDAILRNQVAKQYADLLQKLGYRDDAGNFIQGSVETDAQKQDAELQRSQGLAAEGVTQQAQRDGTLFSGMRGTLQARAEDPFVRGRADLAAATPLTIQQLYEQASGLTNDYVLGSNQELAAAAQRAAANITNNAAAGANVTGAAPIPDAGYTPPVNPNLPTNQGWGTVTQQALAVGYTPEQLAAAKAAYVAQPGLPNTPSGTAVAGTKSVAA